MRLHLDHIEIGFTGATIGAVPIGGDIFPTGSRRDPGRRVAKRFIVEVAAEKAHVFFHKCSQPYCWNIPTEGSLQQMLSKRNVVKLLLGGL
jgi:hypothetical protein